MSDQLCSMSQSSDESCGFEKDTPNRRSHHPVSYEYYHTLGESSRSASAGPSITPPTSGFSDHRADFSSSKHRITAETEKIKQCLPAEEHSHKLSCSTGLSELQWAVLRRLHHILLREAWNFSTQDIHKIRWRVIRQALFGNQIPVYMWRNGIKATLRLLAQRGPDSTEYMATFIYLVEAFARISSESSQSPKEDWIECLADLAHYRIAIEDADQRDREDWIRVAKLWYKEDESPTESIQDSICKLLRHGDVVERINLFVSDDAADPAPRLLRDSTPSTSGRVHGGGKFSRAGMRRSLLFAYLIQRIWRNANDERSESHRGHTDPSYVTKIASECAIHLSEPCAMESDESIHMGFDAINLFTSLNYHQIFLFASQHHLAPPALRDLARKYRMPQHIWHAGLDRLMQQVKKDGSAQDMLYWLQYGYDYIKSLREAAPDLEHDWTECQKGLDLYHYEVRKCLSQNRPHGDDDKTLAEASLADLSNRVESIEVCYNVAADIEEDPTDYLQFINMEAFEETPPARDNFGGVTAFSAADESCLETLHRTPTIQETVNLTLESRPGKPSISTNLSEADPSFCYNQNVTENMQRPSMLLNRHLEDRLEEAAERLTHLSVEELVYLRTLILQCWTYVGQGSDFNIYIKIHGILSRCGLKLESDAGLRERGAECLARVGCNTTMVHATRSQ